MENKRSHLEMIQGVVNRLSHNSSLLKGWSVVLISAMFALSAKDAQLTFVHLAYFPCIVFWGLDGYYLYQERVFRKLYDHVRKMNETNIDFSMDKSMFDEGLNDWFCSTFSKTVVAFHGTVLISIILVTAINQYLK